MPLSLALECGLVLQGAVLSGILTACREFTINLISEWFVEAAHHTCGNYDRGVDELELSGLTPLPSVKVQPAPA